MKFKKITKESVYYDNKTTIWHNKELFTTITVGYQPYTKDWVFIRNHDTSTVKHFNKKSSAINYAKHYMRRLSGK